MTKDGARSAVLALVGLGIKTPEGADPNAIAGLWEVHLSEFSDPEVLRACVLYAGNGRFWPTPADLRAELGNTKPIVGMSGDAAWDLLNAEIRRHGSYQPPDGLGGEWEFPEEHPRFIAGIKAFGGWSAICGWMLVDMPHHRKRWVDAWSGALKIEGARDQAASVVGLLEARASMRQIKGGGR